MKDQYAMTPKQVIDGIEETQKHMNTIYSIVEKITKNNEKLNEIIKKDAKFSDNYFKLQNCLDEIQSEIENLTPDELLTQYDLQDKINIEMYDSSLSGRG